MESIYADVYMTKIISGYETQVVNRVKYDKNQKQMVLDSVLMESHNYDDSNLLEIKDDLLYNDYRFFNDGDDIYLKINAIIPLSSKAITVNNRTLKVLIPTNDYADPTYLKNYFL
jgi:hypothetical protein